MRGWTIAIVTVLSLSGCFGESEDSDATADPHDDMPHDDMDGMENHTMEPTPPVPTLSANVTNTTAPVDVVFQFNVEDSDGDLIIWEFDADGDGTSEVNGEWEPVNGTYPGGNFTFTYSEAGTFNATFTVDDLNNATTAVVQIVATAEAAGPIPEPIVFTGSGLNIVEVWGCDNLSGTNPVHAFDGAIAGTWLFETTGADLTEWYTGSSFDHGGGNSGVIPAGMNGVMACSAPPTTYTITLTHPDYVG